MRTMALSARISAFRLGDNGSNAQHYLCNRTRRFGSCATLVRMSVNDILTFIDAEIATLQQARAVIAGAGKRGTGRPESAVVSVVAKPKQKRKMSPEGRARIVAAVKARWAAKRKAAN